MYSCLVEEHLWPVVGVSVRDGYLGKEFDLQVRTQYLEVTVFLGFLRQGSL